MGLSSDLVYQFSKVVNGKPMSPDTVLRGTIVQYDEALYVQLDGSNEITPISRTVEVAEGDRVEVTIANHSATVTGNLSDPSIGVMRANGLESKIERTAEEFRIELSATEEGIRNSLTAEANSIRKDLADEVGVLNDSLEQASAAIREELGEAVEALELTITETNTRVTNVESSITQTAAQIRSEVKATVEVINSDIASTNAKVVNLESSITQTATQIRSEVTAEVNAINGSINSTNAKVANLESSITQTAAQIRSEVSASIAGVNGSISNLSTQITQNATSITSLVKADEEFSKFQQTVEGFEFMGKGGSVKISGGNINLTGSIKFSDFNTDTTNTLNATATNATNALANAATAQGTANQALADAASAQSTASSAASSASSAKSTARSIANGSYLNGTFINGTTIQSPTIEGNEIRVYGTFQTLDYNGDATGYMGAAMGKDSSGADTYGVAISNKWNYRDFTVEDDDTEIANSYVIVTNAGVRLQYGLNNVVVSAGGIYLNADAPGAAAYYNGNEIGSGSGGDVTVTPVWG